MQKWIRIIALCLAVMTLPKWICAQGQLGAVTGTIYDSSGAVIPEAAITIIFQHELYIQQSPRIYESFVGTFVSNLGGTSAGSRFCCLCRAGSD